MTSHGITGSTPLERLLHRYETTDTKCPNCGYIDDEPNWTSQTEGKQIVYNHTCPSCGDERQHVFTLGQ